MKVPKISKKTLIYHPSKPYFPTKEEVEECWEEVDKIMIQNFKNAKGDKIDSYPWNYIDEDGNWRKK